MTPPLFAMQIAQDPRSWIGGALVLILLLMGGPRSASGQASEVQALLKQGRQAGAAAAQMRTVAERARQAGFSPDATASLLRPVVELAKQDLPTAPLLTKTLEGLAKQVPHARMQPVLQQVRTHTERAGQLVSQWTQRAEVRTMLGTSEGTPGRGPPNEMRTQLVTAVTEAQQQDISAETIGAFLNDLPSAVKRRPVPLAEVRTAVNVLPDLPSSKTSPKASRRLLTAALDAGYSPESLRQLPAALQSARRESKRPADALALGAAQAIARGTPATDVLRDLFRGAPPGVGPPPGAGPPGNVPGSGKPPGRGGKPPGTGPPDNPPGGGPPDNPPGGGPGGGGGGGNGGS